MSYAEELRSSYAEVRKRLGLSNVKRPVKRPVPQETRFVSPPLSQKIVERRLQKYQRIEEAFKACPPDPQERRKRKYRRIEAALKKDEPIDPPQERRISIAEIIAEVAAAHNVTPAMLRGPDRHHDLTPIRHEAMWRAHRETGHSLTVIGHAFGKKDHTTVLYAIRKHESRLAGVYYARGMKWPPPGMGPHLAIVHRKEEA